MTTGHHGTFVISWSQTEVDGLTGAPVDAINVGTAWRWTGHPVRVDAHHDILVLKNAINQVELHQRAAKNARRMLGLRDPAFVPEKRGDDDQQIFEAGFDLTDGRKRYRATLVDKRYGSHPMLLFVGELPPCDQDLWVVSTSSRTFGPSKTEEEGRGVICFVPGTRINTPDGSKMVQELIEGDQVCTKDNGVQTIRWVGERRITGARLYAMPQLRPIRLRANILGPGEPDADLLVSPDHRILVKGPVAQSLFNTPEVMVTARDLVNDQSITVDHSVRNVSYIHLMLDQHQVLWANGVESESFHPAGALLDQIDSSQSRALFERFPDVAKDPHCYGEFARRNLTASEAAILACNGLSGH